MSARTAGLYARGGKRAVDVLVAAALVVLIAPLLVAAALLVASTSRGPVLFRQERLGRSGRTFQVLKFRTMTDEVRHAHVERFGADPSVTAVGVWLRRTKVDELPQLFNVLAGDMSLVGPRPALPTQLEEYDEVARRRLLVRPGMTGLAQVHGNIHLSWPERWRWDVAYVDRIGPGLDARILVNTVLVVLLGEGRYVSSQSGSSGPGA